MNDTSTALTKTGRQLATRNELAKWCMDMFNSGALPEGINTPEKVMLVVETGRSVGMSEVQALSSCMIVNGRVSMYGDGLWSLILSARDENGDKVLGTFSSGYEGDDPEADGYTAWFEATRADFSATLRMEFSVADAKAAGLWIDKKTRHASKKPWAKYPKRMLYHRARTWVIRDLFADIIKGMGVAEEQFDIVETHSRVEELRAEEARQLQQPIESEPEDAEPLDMEMNDDGSYQVHPSSGVLAEGVAEAIISQCEEDKAEFDSLIACIKDCETVEELTQFIECELKPVIDSGMFEGEQKQILLETVTKVTTELMESEEQE